MLLLRKRFQRKGASAARKKSCCSTVKSEKSVRLFAQTDRALPHMFNIALGLRKISS